MQLAMVLKGPVLGEEKACCKQIQGKSRDGEVAGMVRRLTEVGWRLLEGEPFCGEKGRGMRKG